MFKHLIATGIAALTVGAASATATSTPTFGVQADGLRLQAMAERYAELHGYTPAALEAMGARWQGMADLYARSATQHRPDDRGGVRGPGFEVTPATTQASGSSFDWGDAGIGAAAGLAGLGAAALAFGFVRHSRRTKLAL